MLTKNLFLARLALIVLGIMSTAQMPLFAGFPAGTELLTPKGLMPIEDLMLLTMPITTFNPKNGAIGSTRISCIKFGFEFGLIVITTDHGTVTVGRKQRIYEGKRRDFVAAQNLQMNDILFSKEYGYCICLNVEEISNYRDVYDICLDKPFAYFLTELRLLTIR